MIVPVQASRWFTQMRMNLARLISGGSVTVVGTVATQDAADYSPVISTPEAALQSAAVWACCRVIANSIATLPRYVLEETDEGKVKAVNHPLWKILTRQPNPAMTTEQWLVPTMNHLLLQGNAFTFVDRMNGRVNGLWPMTPTDLEVTLQPDRTLQYVFKRAPEPFAIPSNQIVHFRLFTLDGMMGLSVIDFHRDTFAFEALSDSYAAGIYSNGGRPSGVLRYPGVLDPAQAEAIRNSWKRIHGGPAGLSGVAVLEEGAEYQAVGVPLAQLEYLGDKKFSIEQIARIFGVAPHLIGSMEKPTYASVEQQSLEFLRYTINPWVVCLERSIALALLEPPYYFKFNLAGFERPDIANRYRSYATARQWGWMSVNDIRELEDMNRIEGGDVYLEPLNMIPVGGADAEERISGNDGTPQLSDQRIQG